MSKADEMFEKLGYKKFYNINNVDNVPNDICYCTDEFEIKFNMIYEAVEFEKKKAHYSSITMQELQAINEKVKELRLGEQLNKEKSKRFEGVKIVDDY